MAGDEKPTSEENIIFIGNKSIMNYVTSIVVQFTTKKREEVIIKARGNFISKAVSVAEIARKKFLEKENLKVKEIKIDSKELENKNKKMVDVSTIEIALIK